MTNKVKRLKKIAIRIASIGLPLSVFGYLIGATVGIFETKNDVFYYIVLPAIGLVLTAILQYQQATTKNQKSLVLLGLAAGLFLLVGTIRSQSINNDLTNRNTQLLTEIDTLQKQTIAGQQQNYDSPRKATLATNELVESTKKLTEVQSKYINEVKGSGEMPYLDIIAETIWAHYLQQDMKTTLDSGYFYNIVLWLKMDKYTAKDVWVTLNAMDSRSIVVQNLKFDLQTVAPTSQKLFYHVRFRVGQPSYLVAAQVEWEYGSYWINFRLRPNMEVKNKNGFKESKTKCGKD